MKNYEIERIERMIRVLELFISKGKKGKLKKYSITEEKETLKKIDHLKNKINNKK